MLILILKPTTYTSHLNIERRLTLDVAFIHTDTQLEREPSKPNNLSYFEITFRCAISVVYASNQSEAQGRFTQGVNK